MEELHITIAEAGATTAAGAEAKLDSLREERGDKFTVAVARRELRKWLRTSTEGKAVEGLVGRLLTGAGEVNGGTAERCRYLVEQLKSSEPDMRDVGLWRVYWTSWTNELTRFGWSRPDRRDQGIEFWVTKKGTREFHQVKRQHYSGHWTLYTLAQEGVLTDFISRLQDSSARCVFVSGNSAGHLDELSDRARRSASWEEFNAVFLDADEWRKHFNRVRDSVPHLPEHEVFERLKRIRTEPVGERFLLTTIESRVSTLVDGDAATVVDVLAEMASDEVHHELTAYDIWEHLESRGFRRRHWDKDPHVLSAVEEANQRYLSLLRRQAIARTVIPRQEVQTVQDRLEVSSGRPGVLITGEAGIGKSGVMLQVIEELLEAGTPVLAFRADRLEPTQLPDDVGEQIGLPGSPANVLAAVAQGSQCVLVIDQLDALSLASGRNTNLFDCVYEIIRQAQAHPNMHILLACRKFDLDNDYRLRQLKEEKATVLNVKTQV